MSPNDFFKKNWMPNPNKNYEITPPKPEDTSLEMREVCVFNYHASPFIKRKGEISENSFNSSSSIPSNGNPETFIKHILSLRMLITQLL